MGNKITKKKYKKYKKYKKHKKYKINKEKIKKHVVFFDIFTTF